MKQVLTIVCKIQPTLEQVQKLELTLGAFADACNYINATVNPKVKNKNRIQAEVYKTVRQQFNLSANLAVRACARVASNRKTAALKKDLLKCLSPLRQITMLGFYLIVRKIKLLVCLLSQGVNG